MPIFSDPPLGLGIPKIGIGKNRVAPPPPPPPPYVIQSGNWRGHFIQPGNWRGARDAGNSLVKTEKTYNPVATPNHDFETAISQLKKELQYPLTSSEYQTQHSFKALNPLLFEL